MKFERLVIECKNFQERDSVFSVLNNIGFKGFGNFKNRKNLFVHTYDDGDYITYIDATSHENSKRLSFDEFLSKYSNQFHEKIKQAMSDFGLNREELSMKLGYSAPYITKMLTLPQSEKVKKKVVEKIEGLYVDKDIKGDYLVQVEAIQEENEQLKKELDHKNQVLDKRNDLFKDAEYEIASLNKTVESLQIVLNKKNEDIEGIKAAFGSVTKVGSNRIAELENLNKQLGIDLSKRNKDVNLLNFGCIGLIVIVVAMACFVAGG